MRRHCDNERGRPRNSQFFHIGSGAFIDKTGIIITARHVVEKFANQNSDTHPFPDEFVITLYPQRTAAGYRLGFVRPCHCAFLPNDSRFSDTASDIALLKVADDKGELPTFKLPEKFKLREGDAIAAAGFPLRDIGNTNIQPNLCAGIVSQMNGILVNGKWTLKNFVADLAVHPGNSGGPVFDVSTGELLGIVSSQTIRPLNLKQILSVKSETSKDFDPDSFINRLAVWTNLTNCAPSTSIKTFLKIYKEQLLNMPND